MFDWSGETVLIVASGQSAFRYEGTRTFRVLTVNLSFRLYPDADALYAADSSFWQWYGDARQFEGVKIAPDGRAALYCKLLELVDIPKGRDGRRHDPMIFDRPRVIGCGGGNSGFQAVNVAVNAGARRIGLLGFDYCGRHWHDDHPPALRNPSTNQLLKWREHFDNAAPGLAARGVEVVNLSSVSALRAYPVETPESFLAGS